MMMMIKLYQLSLLQETAFLLSIMFLTEAFLQVAGVYSESDGPGTSSGRRTVSGSLSPSMSSS